MPRVQEELHGRQDRVQAHGQVPRHGHAGGQDPPQGDQGGNDQNQGRRVVVDIFIFYYVENKPCFGLPHIPAIGVACWTAMIYSSRCILY